MCPAPEKHLIKLPGVGRKTANVVLNDYFGQPTMAVDTHIFRVSNRTGMAPGKDPVEVELNLLRVTGQEVHTIMRITGLFCWAGIPVLPENQNAIIAQSTISVHINLKL